MVATALVGLALCATAADQLDDLHVRFEATPTALRLGDVVFARISIVNESEKVVRLPPQFSRDFGNVGLSLVDLKRDTTFALRPDVPGIYGGDPTVFKDLGRGEAWLIGYDLLQMPPLRAVEWPFWNPNRISDAPYRLTATLNVDRHSSVGGLGPLLNIKARPEDEMNTLIGVCRGGRASWPDFPAGFDADRASLNWFGFPHAPRSSSMSQSLAELEKLLSPGSLRDVVHLTRLAQAVYDEKDEKQRDRMLSDLFSWLESLPEVERKWMALQLITWSRTSKGLGVYGFQVAVESALRLQAGDKDPGFREFHERHGRRTIPDHPFAERYLNDFDERLKAVEKRLEELGKSQDDLPQGTRDPDCDPFAETILEKAR